MSDDEEKSQEVETMETDPAEEPADEKGEANIEEKKDDSAEKPTADDDAETEDKKDEDAEKDDEQDKADKEEDPKEDVMEPKVELRVEIRHEDEPAKSPKDDEEDLLKAITQEITDPKVAEDLKYIEETEATTKLEIALTEALKRKDSHVERLSGEIRKLKAFISKRKQTYKRKRKDEGAPTRALSAYNIFVQDRFARLAKENETALKSADSDAQLKRVPPASLVASTGNAWKELAAEEKAKYEERAKSDRKRYEEQMAQYQPPDKQANRKRNKTGYNMFFSAHVLRLKQSEMGVPSERGSVARLVGTAWKVRLGKWRFLVQNPL